MKKSTWKKDTERIRKLDYLHKRKYGKTFKYTFEGHQRAISEQALQLVQKYEQTGVLDI